MKFIRRNSAGIHPDLIGGVLHQPFDQIGGLGHPERAAIGHSSRRLVGVRSLGRHVCGAEVIGSGDDMEQARPEFGGLRVGVERSLVGQKIGLQTQDPAVLVQSQ